MLNTESSIITGGRRLAERFDLRRCLGKGAIGVVYEAFDRRRNSLVALKMLTRADPGAIFHLKNEFRALATLAHPNLVSPHELCAAEGRWFITMDLVVGMPFVSYVRGTDDDGGVATLTMDSVPAEGTGQCKHISSPGPQIHRGTPNVPRLRAALWQLVDGLLAVHAAGKLHRDLKPSNVLVAKDGQVKILDFGLAVDGAPEGSQRLGGYGIEGTPAYMAPEQARGDRAGFESDWYAVGVILYEALTGRLPFWGQPHQILDEKQQRMPARPFGRDLPEDLVKICMALLSIDPAERPTGAVLLRVLSDGARTFAVRRIHSPEQNLFVGRERHLSELAQALDDTDPGRPVVVEIHGSSGMGKSALLQAFLRHLRQTPSSVALAARCYAGESVPYRGVDGIVDALTRYLRRLSGIDVARLVPRHIHALRSVFPVLGRVNALAEAPIRRSVPMDAHERRRQATVALAELFSRLSDQSSLVLAIDDFQWADADSTTMLRDLLSLPEAPPCLLLLARGDGDGDETHGVPAFAQTLRVVGVEVRSLEVGPLSEREVQQLQDGLGIHQLSTEVLLRESQGNPYLIHELARRVLLGPESEHSRGSRVDLSEALRWRVEQLEPKARLLLEFICIAGRPVAAETLRAAARVEDAALVLRSLAVESLVTVSEPPDAMVDVYHERIREAVLTALDATCSRTLHRCLAEVLEKRNADPEPIAELLLAAGEGERAFHYAVLAVERALDALAFDRAARYCRIALDLLPVAQRDQAPAFLQTLASALAMAGRSVEAADAYEAALQHAKPEEGARLRSLSAAQMLLGGRLREGIAHVKASLSEYGLIVPEEAQEQKAVALARLAECRIRVLERLQTPIWTAEHGLDLDERTRLDVLHSASLGLYGLDLSPLGPALAAYDAAASIESASPEHCVRALGMLKAFSECHGGRLPEELDGFMGLAADRMNNALSRAWQEFGRGCSAYWRMDPIAASAPLRRAEHLWSTECYGVMRLVGIVRLKLAVCHRLAGRLRDLATDCEQWRRAAQDRGDLIGELWMTLLGPRELCAGDSRAARKSREDALRRLAALSDALPEPSTVNLACVAATQMLAEVDWYEGRAGDAWGRLQRMRCGLHEAAFPGQSVTNLAYQGRALAAIVGAEGSPARVSEAMEIAGELRASPIPGMTGLGWALSAAVLLHVRKTADETMHQLRTARDYLADTNPVLFHCAGLHLAAVQGGEGGERLLSTAEAALRGMGIQDPRRWARMELPGFR
jgi:eukaryotic-like serine/threonine-protein kinase